MRDATAPSSTAYHLTNRRGTLHGPAWASDASCTTPSLLVPLPNKQPPYAVSHSQQRVLKRTQSPEARGCCGWTAVRRGRKNKNTSSGHQTCTYAVPVNLHPPRPKLPCPENEHAARVTSHQGKPTATHIVEWWHPLAPLFKRRSSGRERARAQEFSASTTIQMADGGLQQMPRSSPVSAARKAKRHQKRRAKLRKVAASRRALVSMWVGYFCDRQGNQAHPAVTLDGHSGMSERAIEKRRDPTKVTIASSENISQPPN